MMFSSEEMKMVNVDLPEDIVEEISMRLPVKSLIRFKSVAQSWYARITNPYFITKQIEWSNSITTKRRFQFIIRLDYVTMKSCVSLISNDGEPNDVDVELPFPYKDVEYIFCYGQCNGVFCLNGVYGGEKSGETSLILWNPGTKEVRVIPESLNKPNDMVYVMFGFGIDPITKDYKIVRFGILDIQGGELPPVEVYDLSTNSWRTIDVVVPASRLCYPKCRAYLNGFYHWLIDDDDEAILFFDFSKEIFGKIHLPPGIGQCHESSVVVIDEKLACVATYKMGAHYAFEIWVMNEYGVESSWIKKFVISPHPEFGSFLGFGGEDNEILVDDSGQLVSYNIENQQIKKFNIHGIPKLMTAFGYLESLVPLKN